MSDTAHGKDRVPRENVTVPFLGDCPFLGCAAEIMNGRIVVHVENEDEFFYSFDQGPRTSSRVLAESLGFRAWCCCAE